jgi:Coenzyme PQQ synthesis protein D (PqqD)
MTSAGPSRGDVVLARRPDVESAVLDGETVLYDAKAHMMHWLNASAAVVWAACDGTAGADEIVRAIEADYPGQRSEIEHDVRAIIERFRRLDLLRPVPAEGRDGS